eukprot:TRINITY_DN25716_c0_g1_i1.p1 TRINITY_DN25716_c0_g1~~TRINITY_DN25716_c0_g1_i1.p1  ORF type:complete len:100 (-),score=11.40 TRINITY_DN25716_c0_g1_i1:58-357(-)
MAPLRCLRLWILVSLFLCFFFPSSEAVRLLFDTAETVKASDAAANNEDGMGMETDCMTNNNKESEECIMSRMLAAHADYIYTRHHGNQVSRRRKNHGNR